MSFYSGLLVGFVCYWVFGIFTKGIAEPVQAHLGRLFLAKMDERTDLLKKNVEKSITQIDDLFLSAPINFISSVDRIVNGVDLPERDRGVYRQLLDDTYRVSALLEKHNLNN